jgi:hypothetical protein
MKSKIKITLAMLVLVILLFVITLSFQKLHLSNDRVDLSQQVLPQNYQALLPSELENPLGSGEEVSLEEARKNIAYPIPQLEAEEVKQVWISINPENVSNQSVAVSFKRDLLLIIHKTENENTPDWDRSVANEPLFVKIDVNGISGIGADPGVKEFRGQPYYYPGSVELWVDGLDITLYSDTLSLEELLKVAETMYSVDSLSISTKAPVQTAITPDNLSPTPTELITETPTELPTQTPYPTETASPTP